MDFRTKIDYHSFGVRVSALMLKDDKLYLAKSPKDEYYLLGGAILVNELTEDAIKREIYEEVGVEIEVGQLAFIVENHFSLENTHYHQIEFHYVVTPLSSPNSEMEEGGQTRRCEWVSLNDLENINLNPNFLKTALKNWDGQLKHIVNKDGED
ncbi:NUDIX hydrolase [Streptococcus hyovaginalis]|uniref:NUDIX hydrolase n=1 Tax=Streptococcus hyovaginalis TaxID=149015 RepID=UPI0004227C80|nr:NUDIX domain-containing protein [Streptococcus hyovaginalis]